ncbi:MAG TPA: hypothetical protein VK709_03910 [Candidatus Saccharimonadales bacterium]|nr:hypothetical protein [Candidatus Saccharimonadales bacterium]
MLVDHHNTNCLLSPIAIYDKELLKNTSFQIETFELCTVCGARFGIGHFGESKADAREAEDIEELPRKLIEILAKDHRHERQHKCMIELDQ